MWMRAGRVADFGAVIVGRAAMLAMLLVLTSACAATWVDEAGRTHIVGLVAMTLQPPTGGASAQGVAVETVGASFVSSRRLSAVSFGYSRDELFYIPMDCVVRPRTEVTHESGE